jgi:membrane-associated phospholipid phosphatase
MKAASLAVVIIVAARMRPRSTAARLLHDFLPALSVLCVFNWTGPVVAATSLRTWDATMAALDRALFGSLPAWWFGLLGRPWWLTDAASIAYVSYYAIPVAMAAVLYAQGRREAFDDFAFTVVAAFLVSYACYFLLPTTGPRVPEEMEELILGGSALSSAVRGFLRVSEGNLLDAFPSGHTALSLVFLACGWRLFPRWRALLVLDVTAIIFSTVYLSLHYVVDLVAGVALAALLPAVLPALRRLASPSESVAAVQRPSSNARQRPPVQPMRSNRRLR